MTDRVLPHEEWGRLAHTPLGAVVASLNPATTAVVVVEDTDGAIVACWAALTVVHAEGAWIAEPYRRRVSVTLRLWRAMRRIVAATGATRVVTGANSDEVRDLLGDRCVPLPQEYVLCLLPPSSPH